MNTKPWRDPFWMPGMAQAIANHPNLDSLGILHFTHDPKYPKTIQRGLLRMTQKERHANLQKELNLKGSV